MFGRVRIATPEELFVHTLGVALTMETTVAGLLRQLVDAAQWSELKQDLRFHLEQTDAHVRNLRLAFEAIGEEPAEKPCPAIEGIEKEGRALLEATEAELADDVVLAVCAETEHHEIAVYESLLVHADAMGQDELVVLLRENLEHEQEALRKVTEAGVVRARATLR